MARKIGKWTLDGVGVLMITPLNHDYTLNEDAVRKQIDWVIAEGATSIWPSGFVGEWPQLDEELRKRYFEVCADQVKDRAWVAAGCHGTNLNEVVRLVNHAAKAGCDVAWISPVCVRKPTDDEIIAQYQYILDRTTIPLGVYNAFYTGTAMDADLLMRIACLDDRIALLKDSNGDFVHIATLYAKGLGEKISSFGINFTMFPHLAWGGAGILSSPHATPLAVSGYNAMMNNDFKKALELQFQMCNEWPLRVIPVVSSMVPGTRVTTSGIGLEKAKTSMVLGIEMGPPAPPYVPASEAEIDIIRKDIEKYFKNIVHNRT